MNLAHYLTAKPYPIPRHVVSFTNLLDKDSRRETVAKQRINAGVPVAETGCGADHPGTR